MRGRTINRTTTAMSEPVPRLPQHRGVRQSIDWLKLFQEVEAGETCVAVADRYRAGGQALRVKAATATAQMEKGTSSGRRSRDKAGGGEGERERTQQNGVQPRGREADGGRYQSDEGWREARGQTVYSAANPTTPRHTASIPNSFSHTVHRSPQWPTHFNRRNSLNVSKHYVRQNKPAT